MPCLVTDPLGTYTVPYQLVPPLFAQRLIVTPSSVVVPELAMKCPSALNE